MKILVIFTGGTIGSRVQNGWISTDEATKYTLIQNYRETCPNDVVFETAEPYFLLSENLSAKNINLLISAIDKGLSENYDGIIVTHGTDTLHFSAAAAHLAFSAVNTPIVFVSANFPLENEKSNGFDNFEGAVALIKSGVNTGVYISYKNPEGEHFIHSADKALSFSESLDSIYSMERRPFAIYKDKKITVLEEVSVTPCVKTVFCEKPKILTVCSMPEDSFSYNKADYNAVILRPYHSGTLNTENKAFRAFLEKDKNIPVFLVNAPTGTTYDTTRVYKELGIIPLRNCTFAYAYMKVWAGISEKKNLF